MPSPTPTDRTISWRAFYRPFRRFWLNTIIALFLVAIAFTPEVLAQDRSATSSNPGITTDITLTKTVEVYSYEDLTFTIDSYSVRPGDNLASILKSHGLLPQNPDQAREAQLMRLVGELNPVIANLDLIAPGQTLYLPSARGLEESRPAESSTGSVVSYEIGQPDQSPARVVSRRPPEPELGPGEYRLNVDGQTPNISLGQNQQETEVDQEQPPEAMAPQAPPSSAQVTRSKSSENDGPVATAPDGTVYRTVTVRKGDTLERLLRREGLDRNLIYRGLISLTVELNPGLKNPNMIVAGAQLRIPVGPGRDMSPTPTMMAQNAPAAGSQNGDSSPSKTGEKYSTPTKRLPSAPMPTADTVNARNAYGIIFTRLGENVLTKGRLFLPLDEPPHFDIDTSKITVVELNNGRKVVLDLTSSLSAELVRRLSAKYGEYIVFQPSKKEPFDKALEKLLASCGYYRIYGRDQAFEGGRDVRLKISADWLIWPNADSWNRGQPTIINLAPAADNGTPPVWQRFLGDHGIRVIDLYQGRLLAGAGKSPTPVNNFSVIEVEDRPSAFAGALIRSLGYAPRYGVRVEANRGRVFTGGIDDLSSDPPVFWETESSRNILEYGSLSTEDLEILRKNSFNIISSGKDNQAILKAILAASKIGLTENLVLNGNSSGGPSITLTIAGQSFKFNGRSYLLTPVTLPDNMTSLDPNQNVIVLHYRPRPANEIRTPSASQAPTNTSVIVGQPVVGATSGNSSIVIEDIN